MIVEDLIARIRRPRYRYRDGTTRAGDKKSCLSWLGSSRNKKLRSVTAGGETGMGRRQTQQTRAPKHCAANHGTPVQAVNRR